MPSHQDTSVAPSADVEAFIDALLRIKRPPEDARTVDAEVISLLVDTPGAWPDGAQVMVHVRKRGRGPHALLVHGWQGRTSDMETIGDALVASGFTVWAPHLPGHGTSGGERLSIPLAARVLRAVEGVAGPLALAVGHSIGGACIVQALDEGLQVGRVALLATPTHYGGYVRAMARQAKLEGATVTHLLNRLQEVIGVHPDRIDMCRQAASMRQPALFIHGSDDKVVPHEGAQAAAASWPGAQWLLLEGLGHYKTLLEDPRVVRRVLEFASSRLATRIDQFPQPDSNDSGSVERALLALREANDEQAAVDACDAFLWAMGNNHAGTFYPVVLGALPALEQILVSGRAWAQRAVMESLIDLGGTFTPEQGYETYLGVSVQEALKTFIHSLRPHLVGLATGNDARARSAIDLLELMDDQAA